jgi:hypothetical protein
MSSSKKCICKGILRQVFIRVYRRDTVSHVGIFSTQVCELLPLSPFSRIQSPPLDPRLSNFLSGSLWMGGGGGLWGPRRGGDLRQINTCHKVPLQVHFDDDILLWRLYSYLVHVAGTLKKVLYYT